MPGLVVILVAVTVIAAVLIITAAIAVIVAPVLMTVIIAALVVGSLFGFSDIDVSICYLYQFADGSGPLAVQFTMKLLVLEPFGEIGDGLSISDVGNEVSCL